MGKRLLVALLLVVLVIGLVAFGATTLFRSDLNTLNSLQSQDSNALEPQLSSASEAAPAATVAPVATAAIEPEGSAVEEPLSDPDKAFGIPASEMTPAPDNTNAIRAKAIVNNMTLEEKICQMFFVAPEVLTGYDRVTRSGDATRSAIESYPVGGVIYFGTNLISTDQTSQMLTDIQAYAQERSGFGLFLGVDEEGGEVARLADNLGTTSFEPMATYGAEGDSAKAYEIGSTIASDMTALGFNVDFAPVADVITNEDNSIGNRSFGSDAQSVSDMVAQEVKGFVDGGVLCAPKHFPGHGSTGGDTHNGFAASERTLEELEQCDLLPFRAAIDAGAPKIMVGHMTMTAIDSENPASLSSAVISLLRREYNGIIITDAMNMGAITDLYGAGDAAVKAVSAGCDMILCPTDLESAVSAIENAVNSGKLSQNRIDESVTRILTAKLNYGLAS